MKIEDRLDERIQDIDIERELDEAFRSSYTELKNLKLEEQNFGELSMRRTLFH